MKNVGLLFLFFFYTASNRHWFLKACTLSATAKDFILQNSFENSSQNALAILDDTNWKFGSSSIDGFAKKMIFFEKRTEKRKKLRKCCETTFKKRKSTLPFSFLRPSTIGSFNFKKFSCFSVSTAYLNWFKAPISNYKF